MKVLQVLVLILVSTFIIDAQEKSPNEKLSEQKMILMGAVFDMNGSVIVNAQITAYRSEKTKFESKTLDEGIYTLSLPLSFYKIEVSAAGFCSSKIESYRIVNSTYGKMNLDFVLEVASARGCKSINESQPKQKKDKSKKKEIIITERK